MKIKNFKRSKDFRLPGSERVIGEIQTFSRVRRLLYFNPSVSLRTDRASRYVYS